MHKVEHFSPRSLLLFSFLYFFSSLNVVVAGDGENSGNSVAGENPFSPKAYLVRYWKKHISSDLPQPAFLLNKASPLSAVESATFTKLAMQNALSTQLPPFCSLAKLLCFHDLSASLEKHDENVNFALYSDRNFTNYGTKRLNGVDSFKNYSVGNNFPIDSFRRYSSRAVGHGDKFANYGSDIADDNFNTYGTSTIGGAGNFKNYDHGVNNPKVRFTSYSADTNGRLQSFTGYAVQANAGDQSFTNYRRNGNGAGNDFTTYGKDSNVVGSGFSGYGQNANGESDKFTSYGFNSNVPQNNFKNYGAGGNAAVDTFTSYRDHSNVGDDSFKSYAKDSNAAKMDFTNYGQSYNEASDEFTTYGTHGASSQVIGFKIYGVNTTFKDYAEKKSISFASYANKSSTMAASASGKSVNKWVEAGKFFRERMLKSGTEMPMPDIIDKMPQRSFYVILAHTTHKSKIKIYVNKKNSIE